MLELYHKMVILLRLVITQDIADNLLDLFPWVNMQVIVDNQINLLQLDQVQDIQVKEHMV